MLEHERRAQLVVVADVPVAHAREHGTEGEHRVHVRRLQITVLHLQHLQRRRDGLQQHEHGGDFASEPVLANVKVPQCAGVVRCGQVIQIGFANAASTNAQVLERSLHVLQQLSKLVLGAVVAEIEAGQSRET